MATLKNTTIDDTSALQLPVGTTAQRIDANDGNFRYNTSLNTVEYYSANRWKYLPDIVTSGLAMHLDAAEPSSYPGTGTTWFDIGGSNIHGTLVNGVTHNSSNGGYMSFNGTNQRVTFPDITISNGNYLTIEIWFYSTNGTKYQDIFDVSDNYGVWIVLNNYGGTDPGYITVSFATTGNTIKTPYSTNRWNQLVFMGDGGTSKLYLNGNLCVTGTATVVSNINFNTARIANVDGDRAEEHFAGSISSFKLYTRALTSDEVWQNFCALRGRYKI